jgi:N-acetylglucosamine kinase-like BadF-type ATPase
VAGVDLGATWLRVAGRVGPRRLHARLAAADVTDLRPVLLALWTRWNVAPASVHALVVGSRGIWSAAECRRAERALEGAARRVRVIPDAQSAWDGALGGSAGILVLSGTGSIVVGRNGRGRWARAGGYGPLLGDEGSGFWIGRAWLRATTPSRADRSLLAIARAPAPVPRIAARARQALVRARAGDRVAVRIVGDAQRHLAGMVASVATRLELSPPVRMSWAGSLLTRDPWFRAGVAREVARLGIRARWVPPAATPASAALRLAERILARSDARP